jgi:hypothetical protein
MQTQVTKKIDFTDQNLFVGLDVRVSNRDVLKVFV